MKTTLLLGALGALLGATAVSAEALEGKPTPSEILQKSSASDWRPLDPEETLYIELEHGTVIVALSTQLARAHVEQIKALAREGFYDGLSFYRVIDGFVAQGGDLFEKREIKTAAKSMAAEFDQPLDGSIAFAPLTDADGYAARVGFIDSLPAGVNESGDRVWHLHCAGAVAFARDTEKDSAATEIYIALQPQRYLDRNLTVFGRVVYGMEHLQALRRVAPAQTQDDDLGEAIISMRVAADLADDQHTALQILRSGAPAFEAYVEARRNRPEAFFHHRPDHAGVCDLPIPVRAVVEGAQ